MTSAIRNASVWKCFLVTIFASLLVSGCATTAKKPALYPSSVKNWNGIASVDFVQDFRLQDYSRLEVQPLDTSTTQLPPKDEKTYEPVVNVLKKTDSLLIAAISKELNGKVEVSSQKPDTAEVHQTLVLRGKVADIHPGSQAARYWDGSGAGAAWVQINAEIVDPKSNTVLVSFEQKRVGANGYFGGSYAGLLSDCVTGIGTDVGCLLAAFKTP